MSSYLNKSIHRFKPKAAPRRTGTVGAGSPVIQASSSVERQTSRLQSTPTLEIHPPSPQTGQLQSSTEGLSDLSRLNRDEEAHGQQDSLSGSRGGQSTQATAGQWQTKGFEQRGRSRETTARGTPSTSVVELHPPLPTPDPTQIGALHDQVASESISLANGHFSSRRYGNEAHITQSDDSRRSEEEDDGATSATEATEPTSSRRSFKRAYIEQLASEVVEEVLGSPQPTHDTELEGEEKARKRRRTVTPDGAEKAVISPTLITMSELTRDLRQGRKSKREQRLREKDRIATAQRKAATQAAARDQAQEFMADHSDLSSMHRSSERLQTNDVAASTLTIRPPEPAVAPARVAPRVKVVNGQIVQDEDSRIVDRHEGLANQAGLQAGAPINAIEEDELSRLVNSGTYMKRERHTKWTNEETERFYIGLRWFGTDFHTISLMFPGRSRRQIKLKYNKEERDPFRMDAVSRALREEHCEPDLIKFQEYAGVDVPSQEAIDEDLREDEQRVQAAQNREIEAQQQAAKDREDHALMEAEASRQQGAPSRIQPTPNKDSGPQAASTNETDGSEADSNEEIPTNRHGSKKRRNHLTEGDDDASAPRAGSSKSKEQGSRRQSDRRRPETSATDTVPQETLDEAVNVISGQSARKKRQSNAQRKGQVGSLNIETTAESQIDASATAHDGESIAVPSNASRPKKRVSKAASEAAYIKALAAAADQMFAEAAEAAESAEAAEAAEAAGAAKTAKATITSTKKGRGRRSQNEEVAITVAESAESPIATLKRRRQPPKQRQDAPAAVLATQVELIAERFDSGEAPPKLAARKGKTREHARDRAAQIGASDNAPIPSAAAAAAAAAATTMSKLPPTRGLARSPSPMEDSIVVDAGAASTDNLTLPSRTKNLTANKSAAATVVPKRPRGRPRKDPETAAVAAAAPKRPRGRPRKDASSSSGAAAGGTIGKRTTSGTMRKDGRVQKGRAVRPAKPAKMNTTTTFFTDETPYTPVEMIDMAEALLRAAG